jgi:phosphoadenylyl-sulfate reductase (thioredoxin)
MQELELAEAAARLAGRPAEEVLEWAVRRFARVVFTTGFGAEGCVLLDLIARRGLPIELLTLETGLLFPETHALWRRLEERYGIRIRGLKPELSVAQQAALHGERLWERDPDACCRMRKVLPLRAALSGRDAWVTSIRSDQTPGRAQARVIERDPVFGIVKVNPLLGWSPDDVWAHVRAHQVPVSPLHARGYPSIGCWPCTSPVLADEDPRAGRWRGRETAACGLHERPRASEAAP